MKTKSQHLEEGPHGLENLDWYEQKVVEIPLELIFSHAAIGGGREVFMVRDAANRLVADVVLVLSEEKNAALEWLLNFTYLCLEGN